MISGDSRSIEGLRFLLVPECAQIDSSPIGEFSTDVTRGDASKGSYTPKARGIYHAVGKKTALELENCLKIFLLLF